MAGLTRPEIYAVVTQYIGVKDGYLGDFSYRTHTDFYPQFCDLDIDPAQYAGTMRERFIEILSKSTPDVQAAILRGVLKKYEPGSSELRTAARVQGIQAMIARLTEPAAVGIPALRITSAVVDRAIADAETLLRSGGATSGLDRVHTALHGYLLLVCDEARIAHSVDPSLTDLYKLLRARHPQLQAFAPHSAEVDRILKALAAAIDALNTLRNRGSVAHPNPVLIEHDEALLAINCARTILRYLDGKLSA